MQTWYKLSDRSYMRIDGARTLEWGDRCMVFDSDQRVSRVDSGIGARKFDDHADAMRFIDATDPIAPANLRMAQAAMTEAAEMIKRNGSLSDADKAYLSNKYGRTHNGN